MGIVQSQGVPGGWCRHVDLREFEPGAADRQAFEVGLRPLVGRTSPRDIHALTRDLVRLLKRPRESEAA